jgi:hypothetical protein
LEEEEKMSKEEEENTYNARQWARELLVHAVNEEDPDQARGNLSFLEIAAVHLLATLAYNQAGNMGRVGQIKSVMEIKELIEDEVEWMNTEEMEIISPEEEDERKLQ